MLSKSTIQLLRFPFSVFLLPVFLFAVSQVTVINSLHLIIAFIILHLLVYPSSNGYNSYMDKDTTPVGGLKEPLQPTHQLFIVSVLMDLVAVLAGLLISPFFAAGVLIYILASRAYSYRGIRLKKYPLTGYLVVLVFQGAWIFFWVYHATSADQTLHVPLLPVIAAALLIGGSYPLTQVYQHEADRRDGVQTISMLLGIKGTFIFSMIVLTLATVLLFFTFYKQGNIRDFYLFVICMLPLTVFYSWWMNKVWKDENNANFKNSLTMNVMATLCTACFFIILIIKSNI